MTTFEATVLGLVQGVTEFLPISSTAHLRIVPALAGWADPGAAFTAVIQLGSLVAVIGYFLPELLRMVRAAIAWAIAIDRSRPSRPRAIWVYLIVGTVPIGVAGLAFKHAIEGSLRSLWVIATALIVVGLAMAWIERTARRHRDFEDITLRDVVPIGGAQALALVPGVSRLRDHVAGGDGGRVAARGGGSILVRRGGRDIRAAQGVARAWILKRRRSGWWGCWRRR